MCNASGQAFVSFESTSRNELIQVSSKVFGYGRSNLPNPPDPSKSRCLRGSCNELPNLHEKLMVANGGKEWWFCLHECEAWNLDIKSVTEASVV